MVPNSSEGGLLGAAAARSSTLEWDQGICLSLVLRAFSISIESPREVTSGGLAPLTSCLQPIYTSQYFWTNKFNMHVLHLNTPLFRGSLLDLNLIRILTLHLWVTAFSLQYVECISNLLSIYLSGSHLLLGNLFVFHLAELNPIPICSKIIYS